jgi:hypothetical protein
VKETIEAIISGIADRIKNEPVLVLAVIQTGLALAVGFGLKWTGEQVALTVAFSAAVLGLIARARVTPV